MKASIIVLAAVSVVLSSCVNSPNDLAQMATGYAFARLDFYGKNTLFMLFLTQIMIAADVLILPMTDNLAPAIRLATDLREKDMRVQLYSEPKKFKAKMSYADKLGIPYVVFLGEDEINAGVVACKDMKTGEQTKLDPAATIYRIKAGLAELEKGAIILE